MIKGGKMKTIKEWLTENKDAYTDRAQWITDCATQLGFNRKAASNVAARIWPSNKKRDRLALPKENGADIINTSTFLDDIDMVKKVLSFLDTEVQDNYIEDERLRRRFGISRPAWKEMCRLPLFEDRRFTYTKAVGGTKTTVWSSKRGVRTARETISLARYES